MSLFNSFLSLRNADKGGNEKYQAIAEQPMEEEIKSETRADNDTPYFDHMDPSSDAKWIQSNDELCSMLLSSPANDAKWIQSNDEVCSMLLSSPSSLQQNLETSEYKDFDLRETKDELLNASDDNYDSFNQLAQEMAINPNLDKQMGTLFSLTSPSSSSSSSSMALPLHDALIPAFGHDTLITNLGYPVVATLAEQANESDIAIIIEKIISSFEDEPTLMLTLNQLILSAFLLSSKTLIFWTSFNVNNSFFEEGLVKEIEIQGLPSTLCFCDSKLSPVVEITFLSQTFPNDLQRQNLIDKLRRVSDSTIFLRPCGFIILFKSMEDMNSQIKLIETLLETEHCLASVAMINCGEFQYLKCKTFSRNNASLSKTMFSLRAQGSSLTSLVQSSVCLLPQQPAILAVSTYSNFAQVDFSWYETPKSCLESSMEDIFLLLPSTNDKEILESVGSIELPGGYVIVTCPTQTRVDNPFVFGAKDVTAESLIYKNDMLSQQSSFRSFSLGSSGLDGVASYPLVQDMSVSPDISNTIYPVAIESKTVEEPIQSKEVYIFWDIESCRLAPDDDVEIVLANTEIKLLDYVQNDFRAMRTCFVAKESSYITKKQNDDIESLFKVMPYSKGFGVESSMRVEIQKLRDLYRDCTKPTMCLVFGNTNDCISIVSTLFLEGFTSIILFNCSDDPLKFPCHRALWSDIRTLQQFVETPIRHISHKRLQDVEFTSFVKSGHYVNENVSDKRFPSSGQTTTPNDSKMETVNIPTRNIALHFKKLILWGTQDNGLPETEGESTPRLRGEPFMCTSNDDATIVILNMDDVSEKYALYVIGNELRVQRAQSLKTMVLMASNPKKQLLQKDWTCGHLKAIQNSKLLSDAERESSATVYFNSVDMSAEIVSLTYSQTTKMVEFLETLSPRQSSMTISKINTANLSEKRLFELRYSHALFVDTKSVHQTDTDEVTIYVYGFGLLFQEALANIIQTNKTTPRKLSCDIIGESYGQVDVHRVSPENKNKKVKAPKTSGSFVFQDRESGMFYTTFESEIRLFVSKQFDVSITETDHHISDNAKVKASQQSRTPALKIEYSGRNASDVQQVRNYLEQFNPYFLDRKQVYFPMADANKYKELNQVKSKQDHVLRNIRNRLLSDKNNVVDPLNSDGFINIRIKPPMHARGIKRMTLPTDVTVTICSPTGKHEHLQQLRAIENIFLGVDSGYLTVCVEMQNTSTIAKELTLRSTRDDFINHYNLVGLRWLDEGSRLSNNIGIAKIWASSWKSMDSALEAIKRGGGIIIDETKTAKSLTAKSNLLDESIMKEKTSSDDRIICHWPHSSCRYVFLAEPLKKELSDLLNSLRSDTLTITSPYRDKSDHLACMLIEGDKLDHVANQIESYLAKIASQVHSIQIVLSDAQKKLLTQNDLVRLKEVQGTQGVHFLLEPATSDLQSSSAIFDLRVHFNDVRKDEYNPNGKHELLSIHALCSKTRQIVELQVLPSSSGVGWEYMCCLLIIDDSYIGLTQLQLTQLNSGHVLVDKDNLTGKMLLRSKIIHNDLEAAISRGLNIAEQLQIEGVTIIAPTNLDLNLSVNEIRTLTLETIINIIWTKSITNIKKIICVETMSSELKDEKMESVLEPAGGNQMALCLLYMLQKANSRQNIQLNCCNVPLPKSIPAETIVMRRNIEGRAKSGPLVIKGLVPNLVEAVKAVKQIIL